MADNFIQVDVPLHQSITVNVDIDQVIDTINEMPLKNRYNYISILLNRLITEAKEGDIKLTFEQRELVKAWLLRKTEEIKRTPFT